MHAKFYQQFEEHLAILKICRLKIESPAAAQSPMELAEDPPVLTYISTAAPPQSSWQSLCRKAASVSVKIVWKQAKLQRLLVLMRLTFCYTLPSCKLASWKSLTHGPCSLYRELQISKPTMSYAHLVGTKLHYFSPFIKHELLHDHCQSSIRTFSIHSSWWPVLSY